MPGTKFLFKNKEENQQGCNSLKKNNPSNLIIKVPVQYI